MRRIFLAMLLVVGMTTIAQERKMKHDGLTSEQKTELRVKQMTLDLDLNESQQKQIKTLLLSEAKERETNKEAFLEKKEKGEKPSKEEMYDRKINRLDNQIEFKAKMKKILNEKQMEKWEKMHAERKGKEMHRREMR